MKDKASLITLVVGSIITILTIVGVILLQNSTYGSSNKQLSDSIAKAKTEISTLKSQKDANNYTPTEVVVAFLNDIKGDNETDAKLYLASSVQNMDIKNTLKLGTDLSNINVGDNEQSIDGDSATVEINIQISSDTVARKFIIAKENDAWKITGVSAE